jgi:hypothetical protein
LLGGRARAIFNYLRDERGKFVKFVRRNQCPFASTVVVNFQDPPRLHNCLLGRIPLHPSQTCRTRPSSAGIRPGSSAYCAHRSRAGSTNTISGRRLYKGNRHSAGDERGAIVARPNALCQCDRYFPSSRGAKRGSNPSFLLWMFRWRPQ